MKKNLSALGLLWISLTSIIGSGWLFGSLYSAHFAGPAAILAWPIGGALLLLLALSYAEIGTMFPHSDTLARLPLYTHGQLTSVIMSGLGWVSLALIPVIEAQGLLQYASNYIPGMVFRIGIHQHNTMLGSLVIIALLISFVLINYFGIRFFARINTSFTLWKISIPLLTIIALTSTHYHSENFTQYGGFMPYGWKGIMSALSGGGILFSLLGFRQVIVMMGQIDNPGKYVPIILISSILLTTALYTGLQWSFISSMDGQALTKGWANLTFAGDAGPFAALAALSGIIWLSYLLYFDACIAPYSTGLVYTTTAAHMLASMGTTGAAPAKAATMNKNQVPWVGLLVNFLLATMMSFLLHGWQEISACLVSILMVSYALGPISLACLRQQLPLHQRPFRLRLSGLIGLTGFYICTVGVYWSDLHSVSKLLTLTLIGLILYLGYVRLIKKRHTTLDAKNAVWLFTYLLGLGLFSYYGNYGGTHFIPLYWDLLYLFLFSSIIYVFAYVSRKPGEYTQSMISQIDIPPS